MTAQPLIEGLHCSVIFSGLLMPSIIIFDSSFSNGSVRKVFSSFPLFWASYLDLLPPEFVCSCFNLDIGLKSKLNLERWLIGLEDVKTPA